jgi:hypothetical protein
LTLEVGEVVSGESALDPRDFSRDKEKLTRYMEEQKVYLQTEFTLKH